MLSAQITELLRSKASRQGNLGLTSVTQTLCDEWGVDDVVLLDGTGRRIHGRTLFQSAVENAHSVELRFSLSSTTNRISAHLPVEDRAEAKPESSSPPEAKYVPPSGVNGGSVSPVPFNQAFLIREFCRRELLGKPLAASFLVNQLLPGLGFPITQAKQILRLLEAQGIVHSKSVPSQNNPERTATLFEVNRNHPAVRDAIGEAEVETFEPVPIRGEPASATLMRDRR